MTGATGDLSSYRDAGVLVYGPIRVEGFPYNFTIRVEAPDFVITFADRRLQWCVSIERAQRACRLWARVLAARTKRDSRRGRINACEPGRRDMFAGAEVSRASGGGVSAYKMIVRPRAVRSDG